MIGRSRRPGDEAPGRKTFRLHQAKIDRAREVLGTSTETETIERALRMVFFGHDLLAGVQEMRGAGLVNVLDD